MQPVIESLSIQEKRSLLASLLNKDRSPLRLSTTQERLWQLCQVHPETPFYNFQTSVELQGQLSVKALEIAALRVVLRHEVFRTCYGTEKGKPALSLVAPGPVPITLHDLSDVPPQGQKDRLEALGKEDAQRSFDLKRPPLLRLTLVRVAPHTHRLYLTMHHIVSDFLSLDLFLFELAAFYSAAVEGKSDNLPTLASGYQDFARMQRSQEVAGLQDAHLDYWRRTLADAAPIEWFSDHVRPAIATGKGLTEFFDIPVVLMRQVDAYARRHQATPFMVLLAAFYVVVYACSRQDDVTIGCPMAGRTRIEYESLIGMFSYPVLMRTKIAAFQDFPALLQRVRKVTLEAAGHGDLSLAKIADSASHSGSQLRSLLRAVFSYVSALKNLHFDGLVCRRRPTNRGITDLDLFVTVYPDLGEWHGVLEYNPDLFEPHTVRRLIAGYIGILQGAVTEPGLSVMDLAARMQVKAPACLTIAATFTADPIDETLRFWASELDLPFKLVLAPYNQLFQQLMDHESPLFSSSSALNVLLVRLEDWIRNVEPEHNSFERLLERCTHEFIRAVHSAIARMSCPLKIYLCPASAQLGARISSVLAMAEQSICEAFAGASTVEVLRWQSCVERYSVIHIHDPQTDRAANIPYTPAFYAALGTAIARQLRVQVSKPCKVLVLDCDNTLWQGLCGEDGAQGVVISEGHRALQRFVLQQAASGVLICLNSKNTPGSVLAVFRENSEMILKESDITSHRINWEPKSSNLHSLAEELQLGLDSFVFLDDDAHECAEVVARCPQVLTIRLPQQAGEFPHFLQHLWVFDRENVSQEDRRRTGFYCDNQRRDAALRQSTSLAEFLATLELRVDTRPAAADQILRIAQLSQRTTQFNGSGLVFNACELQRLLGQGFEVMAVEVGDRFGEYGLVGAVMYRKDREFLAVEAFYLSCRVLGRGVEHRILPELGRVADAAGLGEIRIHYNESARNQPFRRFLDRLPGRLDARPNGPQTFVITVTDALHTKASPEESSHIAPFERAGTVSRGTTTARSLAGLARLPKDLSSAAQILSRIDNSKSSRRELRITKAFIAPNQGLENAIAAEWCATLRLDKVGRDDNFFDLGGNSLLLVRVNGNLISKLGIDISITHMFRYPTVVSLAAHISGHPAPDPSHETRVRAAKVRATLETGMRRFRRLGTAMKPASVSPNGGPNVCR
jgi:FkbH-like protein